MWPFGSDKSYDDMNEIQKTNNILRNMLSELRIRLGVPKDASNPLALDSQWGHLIPVVSKLNDKFDALTTRLDTFEKRASERQEHSTKIDVKDLFRRIEELEKQVRKRWWSLE